ncbi:hypothetical protein L3X38_032062 [Prunus dulcis]|uniref:Integrase zinc-binding domain-containing protein n=1 Tax=Prunus dulcis TaxID=3755 RepID=A0AAD4YVJ8_PRUDU|nr:hypothetical protein L3X38_032062 [Prunus dulcis]
MALNYLMWNGDLVRKSKDEVLLRCLGKKEYMKVMGETYEGICGAHQGGRKMCWLIRRYGYFWPTMMKDCIDYSKRCEACQRHSPIHQAPSVLMNPVVKPWLGLVNGPSRAGFFRKFKAQARPMSQAGESLSGRAGPKRALLH